MIIRNEDIGEAILEIPAGHRHVRTTLLLNDGTELVFQEATLANLSRAFITLKSHPVRTRVRLKGTKLEEKKEGYADWQLIETEE